MAYPHNEQTITEVDPMTARNVLGWLGQLVELPSQYEALKVQMAANAKAHAEHIDRLEAKIAEVVAKNGELSDRVAKIAQENENLKGENRWLSNSLEGSRQEVRALNETIRVKNTEIGGLEGAITDLKGQLDSAKRANVDLSADVIDRDEEIAALKRVVDKLQAKINRMVSVANDEFEALATGQEVQSSNLVEEGTPSYRPFAGVGQGPAAAPTSTFAHDGQHDPDLGRPEPKPEHDPATMPEKPYGDPFAFSRGAA